MTLNEKEKKLINTKNEFADLSTADIFYKQNITWWSEIDEDYKNKLENNIDELNKKINNEFKNIVSSMLINIENDIKQSNTQKNNIINSENYKTGKQYSDNNVKLQEINKKLTNENNKKNQIEEKNNQLIKRKNIVIQSRKEIVEKFQFFKEKSKQLEEKIHFTNEDINFYVSVFFNKEKFQEFLISSFDMRVNPPLEDVTDIFTNGTTEQLIQFIKDINNNKYSVKPSVNREEFLKKLFSTNWYEYQFDITYENDTFSQMSPGKQAFIILKLLLNISTKECQILIDQPEDSLDNRAIYHELVKYIRQTKTKRQIILVTHNPNIVVGADAELVIVANQHGSTNKNSNGYKFQYKSGSLESDNKEKGTDITLDKMNIREHICDILEGGKEAFEHREKKYGFK